MNLFPRRIMLDEIKSRKAIQDAESEDLMTTLTKNISSLANHMLELVSEQRKASDEFRKAT